MIIKRPFQVVEFFTLPSEIDVICDLCIERTASHYVRSIRGIESNMCGNCFSSIMSVEMLMNIEYFQKEN